MNFFKRLFAKKEVDPVKKPNHKSSAIKYDLGEHNLHLAREWAFLRMSASEVSMRLFGSEPPHHPSRTYVFLSKALAKILRDQKLEQRKALTAKITADETLKTHPSNQKKARAADASTERRQKMRDVTALANKIRRRGESWHDAIKRAMLIKPEERDIAIAGGRTRIAYEWVPGAREKVGRKADKAPTKYMHAKYPSLVRKFVTNRRK